MLQANPRTGEIEREDGPLTNVTLDELREYTRKQSMRITEIEKRNERVAAVLRSLPGLENHPDLQPDPKPAGDA